MSERSIRGSLEKTVGRRAEEISRWDREFQGFLTMFAKLPDDRKKIILRHVEELRAEAEGDIEKVLEGVKALAGLYGLIARDPRNETDESGKAVPFRASLGQISESLAQMAREQRKGQ